jgi:hypothetical protein
VAEISQLVPLILLVLPVFVAKPEDLWVINIKPRLFLCSLQVEVLEENLNFPVVKLEIECSQGIQDGVNFGLEKFLVVSHLKVTADDL